MKPLAIGSIVLAVITTGLWLSENRKADHAESKYQFYKDMSEREITILREQLDDMEFEFTKRGSYEDGYAAALVRVNSGNYADGFADAEKKFKTQDYANGYHNALEQFGTVWMPVDLKKTVNNTATGNVNASVKTTE